VAASNNFTKIADFEQNRCPVSDARRHERSENSGEP
jgi:hypothetical protein